MSVRSTTCVFNIKLLNCSYLELNENIISYLIKIYFQQDNFIESEVVLLLPYLKLLIPMTITFTRFGVRFVRKICNAFGEHGAGLIDSMTKSLRFNVGLSLSTSRFSFFFSFFNSYNLMRKKSI